MRSMSSKRADLAAIVAVVVIIVGLLFAIRPHGTTTIATSQRAGQAAASSAVNQPRTMMLVISDSYVAGIGRDETAYGCMAAARLGWLCKVAPGPGTGYISGGPANRFRLDYIGESTSFDERLAGLWLKYQPNVVLLDGGRYDSFAPAEAVYNVMVSTIADVQRAWPDATVVFVRPRFLSRPADDLGFGDALIARLQSDPQIGPMLIVVDPIGGMAGQDTSSLVQVDKAHPNRRGELAMASALSDDLIAAGFTPST